MSIAGALRSKHAEEFKLHCPAGEDNWKSRMTFASTLAEAISSDPRSAPTNIAATLEPFYPNLIDCALCERTTLSNAACRLLGALPKVLGKDIHPQLDRILPALIRQCASTKAVAQKSASAAISNIINLSPFHPRTLWHVCQAFEDKYTAPKLYAPGWLQLIIENFHPALHPDRDYMLIIRTLAIGLVDADNNVRVNTRAAFWAYHKIDPTGAEGILNDTLHPAARTALLKDPNNPNKFFKDTDTANKPMTLAQIKKAAITERTKTQNAQRSAAERLRVISSATTDSINTVDTVSTVKSITTDDFTFGQPELSEYSYTDSAPKSGLSALVIPTKQHNYKTTSRPIAIHKKGSSHDGQVQFPDKKQGSADTSRSSHSKQPTSAIVAEASITARPLLSAPVRRPRIHATPINVPQPSTSSRPASRTGASHLAMSSTDSSSYRTTNSSRDTKSSLAESQTSIDSTSTIVKTRALRPEVFSDAVIMVGKGKNKDFVSPMPLEYYHPSLALQDKENMPVYIPRVPVDKTSPTRIVTPQRPWAGPTKPPVQTQPADDGLTVSKRQWRMKHDIESDEMRPLMGPMVLEFEGHQEVASQMHVTYPALTNDGTIDNARRGLEKALEYLNKDALDAMGFRKLRKLVETYGRQLIVDQALYDLLFVQLLQKFGSFDEFIIQAHELKNENHPRYIRQALVSMINVLIINFPFEWSAQYQGPTLATLMVARCFYSANCSPHENAPYKHHVALVDHINASIEMIAESCIDPLECLDEIGRTVCAAEEYLLNMAPHNSEIQESWASYNPYSKAARLANLEKSQNADPIHNPLKPFLPNAIPKRQPLTRNLCNLEDFSYESEPAPLPIKLPLLMETALYIFRLLFEKAQAENISLGHAREEVFATFVKHVMLSYSVIIRREVMTFVRTLVRTVHPHRFLNNFTNEEDRNMLLYYLEKK